MSAPSRRELIWGERPVIGNPQARGGDTCRPPEGRRRDIDAVSTLLHPVAARLRPSPQYPLSH